MQSVEMLKEKSAFDEMGGFCKNCPIHRRVSGKVRGMDVGLCREVREEKPGERHEKTVSEPGC